MRPSPVVGHGPQGAHPGSIPARVVALALDGVFLGGMVVALAVRYGFGQLSGKSDGWPTDNWWLMGPMLCAGVAALAGGAVALAAAVRGDRHVIILVPLALGGLVVLSIVGVPVLTLPLIAAVLVWFLVQVLGGKQGRT